MAVVATTAGPISPPPPPPAGMPQVGGKEPLLWEGLGGGYGPDGTRRSLFTGVRQDSGANASKARDQGSSIPDEVINGSHVGTKPMVLSLLDVRFGYRIGLSVFFFLFFLFFFCFLSLLAIYSRSETNCTAWTVLG